jgi:ABC-type Fe3+ transport system permease subunit
MNPPPLPVRKRFPWILYWIVLFLIILFAFAPIGSVMLCGIIANAYGCKVDEGSVHPCIINGYDYGQLLYSLFVMGWLMLVSLPGGTFAFVIWLIVLILHRERWRKRFAANLPPIPPPPAPA